MLLVRIAICFLVLTWGGRVLADVVVPQDRVREGVTIRSQPTSQSTPLGLLRPGESLRYDGSVPRWHRVRLSNGAQAYVSKSWTTVIAEATAGDVLLHAVDVGTGLAIVLEGEDFTLVYDGGSNDDLARGDENRLLAYLRAALPDLSQIDHLVLSHPHRDHVELLPDLFDHYEIANVWDSGRLHPICGYRAFLTAIATSSATTYHNALGNFGTHAVQVEAKRCYGIQEPAETLTVARGSRIDENPVALGTTATMTFLYADGTQHSSPNENSLVVRVDVGDTRILMMGDAEAGGRDSPSEPPAPHSIEGNLLGCCAADVQADVLVVGHHGSRTSSRTGLLDAVGADHFIVSSGPMRYGSVVLPDADVISELAGRGTVWRTDRDDVACATNAAKIGPDNDDEAGGCDNVRLNIPAGGGITGAYWVTAD